MEYTKFMHNIFMASVVMQSLCATYCLILGIFSCLAHSSTLVPVFFRLYDL